MGKRKGAERRAADRVVTGGDLPGQLALELETDVLQLSEGGMMVEARMPFEAGSRHEFTLTIGDEELRLSGLVRNCQPYPPKESPPQVYRIGIEFCDVPDSHRRSLARFVSQKLGN